MKQITDNQITAMVLLHEDSVSVKMISKRLKIHPATIIKYLTIAGVYKKKKELGTGRLLKPVKMYSDYLNIAKRTDRSYQYY